MKKDGDIIVYVISHYTHGDLSDYVLDFRLKEDYELYQGSMSEFIEGNQNPEEESAILSVTPSLFILKNVPLRESGYRFREDSYYQLNIRSLLESQFIRPENPGLIIGTYDFSGNKKADKDLPLLQKRHALSSADLLVDSNERSQFLLKEKFAEEMKIRVRDIDQGNWNEVMLGGDYYIIYDIGTSLYASSKRLRDLVMTRYSDYASSKPLLLLSHWDADHINCLAAFNPKELKACFSGVCCMSQMKSMLSKQIYDNLASVFGKDLYSYDPKEKKYSAWERRVMLSRNAAMYIGTKSRNINYSGMGLFLKTNNGSANLTGDIKLEQAYDIYQAERKNDPGLKNQNHLLVAPHHGGRYSIGKKIYDESTSKVAISVGRRNHYGHPEERMLQLYMDCSNRNVHRTDLRKDCEFVI